MRRISKALAALCAAAAFTALSLFLGLTSPASAASLTQVTSFGANPGGAQMYVYVPDTHPANPAILLALHGCGGSGPGFYSGSEFASLADRYGFVVIYPSAEQQAGFGKCWDTWSTAAKVRGGGSDPVSLVSMITYVEQTYHGDANRVYVTGSSSGGMMTDEMLTLYPDVFKAGAAYMGVPFGCFANAADYPPGTSKCTGGSMVRTAQQWGDAVRAAYPGYSGPRPPIQLWHGTADNLVPYQLLQEDIKQWTNVFGLSQTPTSTDTPQSGWNRSRFADSSGKVDVEAYSIQGAGHELPKTGMAAYAIHFFGLDSANSTTGGTSSGTTTGTTTGTSTGTTAGTSSGTSSGTTTGTTSGTSTGTSTGSTGGNTGHGCTATYKTVNSWQGGFQSEITVTNSGNSATSGWQVSWTEPSGSAITQMWNAVNSGTSGAVTATNTSYNGNLGAGASTTFGFTGSGSAPNPTLSCTTG
jgi:poly(hydroxyalkanoate) depolymerase family esterase